MPAQYHFLSEYRFRGDPERLWEPLVDVEQWPAWWSWLKRIEVLRPATGPDGLGSSIRSTVRAPAGYGLVYTIEVEFVDRPRRIDITSTGDLIGVGRFQLGSGPEAVATLAFTWLVSTPKRWMSAAAPVARPMFVWNHDRMMRAFGEGLAERSGLELLEVRNSSLRPGDPGFQVMPPAPA
ncbi:hypothetical protein [Tessaracoccus oleiagri]|uniref:Polyketide cyclase / dehydrase and lipid transport n=1 Tax=Tessaracoccus oleiagri TaxID=686624 RepID=A0A1G9MFI2_9ACTN|nr:hypothetical protein [Tessaracoccus oleiagri]SDL73026.1 Polyketide cyclase / dehydrase and lipid transport [Tessaracoccus oleiagri]